MKNNNLRFCESYLRTMNPQQAAVETNSSDGFLKLSQSRIQLRLDKMRSDAAAQIRREDVLRRLAQLAFGNANDPLRLALGCHDIHALDLSAVAEFKVTDKGVEVKLIDRLRALESLWNLLESGGDDGVNELYQALEDAASQIEGGWADG